MSAFSKMSSKKEGKNPACAACKFQRRRCTPHCPLAPYFPADQMDLFESVHRLFGVNHLKKTLKEINDDAKRLDAMKSIKYESYVNQKYPIDMCLGITRYLQQQIVLTMRELQLVQAQIAIYKKKNISKSRIGNSNKTTDDILATKPLVIRDYYDEMCNYSYYYPEHARATISTVASNGGGRGGAFLQGDFEVPIGNIGVDRSRVSLDAELMEHDYEINILKKSI